MNVIWLIFMVGGSLLSLVTGRVEHLMDSVLGGAAEAVDLMVGLTGSFCLWVGIEKLAQRSGLMEAVAKASRPFFGRLFPHLKDKRRSLSSVSASILSNVLGLGSATPLGLNAMQEIKKECKSEKEALDSMSRLVVINAAGFCIFPQGIIALRSALGSNSPSIVAGPCALAGAFATLCGLLAYSFHAIKDRRF